MFSKIFITPPWLLALALTLASLFISCTPKVGEAPPPQNVKTMGNLQCLTNLKPVVAAFGRGEASDEQVSDMWGCAGEAIKNFKHYVYGRTEDRFSPDELAKFLEDDFLDPKGPKITPALQSEFMELKRLLIGGSNQFLTRAELDGVVDLIEKFKAMSLRVNPYIKVLLQEWDPSQMTVRTADQIQRFEKASEATQDVARSLANIFLSHHQDYDLNRIAPLVKEFALFTQQDGEIAKAIDAYLPVLKKVKKAVSGGDEQQIKAGEWRNFTLTAAQGYLQYLRYYYFVVLAPQGDGGLRTDYIAHSAEDFINGLKELIQGKPAEIVCAPHITPEFEVAKSRPKHVNSRHPGHTDSFVVPAPTPRAEVSCITKKELSEVLQTFSKANPSFKISDTLINEVMKLKAVYFGGTMDSFATPDLERGGLKLGYLRQQLPKLLPYFAVYFMKWDPATMDRAEGQRFVLEAQAALNGVMADSGNLFESSYDLQSLANLLHELQALYGDDKSKTLQGDSLSHLFAKYLPLVKDTKNLLFSDNDSVVKKDQWGPFMSAASRAYGTSLYYVYFVGPTKNGTDDFLDGLRDVVNQGRGLVAYLLEQNKNQSFSASQIHRIVEHLSELGVLPEGLSGNSVQSLVNVALSRVFWPAERRLSGSQTHTFSGPSLNNIVREFQIWYETEKMMLHWGPQRLSQNHLHSAIVKTLNEQNLSTPLREGLQQLELVTTGDLPQVLDSKQRLIIDRNATLFYNTESLSQLNLHRALSGVLTRAAINDRDRLEHNQGLTLDEAQGFFAEIRPALIDLGLVDSDNVTFIQSRFRESNVFMIHSNGDTLANRQEITDLIGMIFSGASINSEFQKSIASRCGVRARPGRDVMVDENCLYDVYYIKSSEYMKSMPRFQEAFRTASPDQFKNFFVQILKAAGHIPNDQHKVRLSVVALVPHVIQYMEMLYARFDADQNGIVDTTEALNAYPSFAGVLAELTKDQPMIHPEDLPALFTYILRYGGPPGGAKDYLFRWLPWKRDRSTWNVSADRQQVAQIFGFIAERTRESDKPKLTEAEIQEFQKTQQSRP